jgi:hypothetical protein
MGWIALSVFWVVLGLASIVPVLMTPMLFDAPGSTSSRLTIAVAIAIAAFPISCLLGAALPWLLRTHPFAKAFFLAPVVDMAVVVLLFGCIQIFNGGMLSGGR